MIFYWHNKLIVFLPAVRIQEARVLMQVFRKLLNMANCDKQIFHFSLAAFCFYGQALAVLLLFRHN